MNLCKKLSISLLFLAFAFSSHAQFRHFPQGHEAVFQYQNTFIKAKFDSIIKFNNSFFIDSMLHLWDIELVPCTDSSIDPIILCSLADLGFGYQSSDLIVAFQGDPILIFNESIIPGQKTSAIKGNQYIYDKKDWYQANGISDSAAYFYPIDGNGIIDYSAKPFILGLNIGWIKLGDVDLIQFSKIINGIAQDLPPISWKTFFPERTGDIKVWEYTYFNMGQVNLKRGRIDSFLQVTVYADSITGLMSTTFLNSDFTFTDPQHFTYTLKGNPMVKYALADTNIAAGFTFKHESIYGQSLNWESASNKFSLIISHNGFTRPLDSCTIYQIADIFGREIWDSEYGYRLDVFDGFSSSTEELVAARVGQNSFGNLNVLGTNKINAKSLSLFPNPAKNRLHFYDIPEQADFVIYDLAGHNISQGKVQNSNLDIESLHSGIYLIQIQSNSMVYTAKFVKE